MTLKPVRTGCGGLRHFTSKCGPFVIILLSVTIVSHVVAAEPDESLGSAQRLTEYFEQMSRPKPLRVLGGADWDEHASSLRQYLLSCAGLQPLPERCPLDVHESEVLEHPWCTVRRVYYQLWPGVYASGLLYMPKQLREPRAPAILCPHGHWNTGSAHPTVQTRCLNFARLGYVTFSSTQYHYEDLWIGISHQTLMIWNNMRALDYLESLAQVDRNRIGVAGASGGGLQTQMLAALDNRVKAATIVGLTCDFREIMFPDRTHCACNHFPNVMRRTDHPEISTLALPAAVQYLTMNDWTKTFEAKNFPTIEQRFAAHGRADRTFCKYFDTEHNYDKSKREYTYLWMNRWLGGADEADPPSEPETKVFPIETLEQLQVAVDSDKGFGEIGRLYREKLRYHSPQLHTVADWRAYRHRMTGVLADLLGEAVALPRTVSEHEIQAEMKGDLRIENVAFPSEGPVTVPATVVGPARGQGRLPVTVFLSGEGRQSLTRQDTVSAPFSLASDGQLVVIADIRTLGELFLTGGNNAGAQRTAWERNGIVWGRPVPGMAATDVRSIVDALATRSDVDMKRVTVVARSSPDLAIAALFAMALDSRIARCDLDFSGACFENRKLPLVANVLQHGDVLQWAALVADRQLVLRNIPAAAGDPAWLRNVFDVIANPTGLQMEKNQ